MVTGKATSKLTGPDTVRGAIDIIEQYFAQGWTDGLPIVPPTEELVDRMIAASGRDAMDILGVVPPRQGVATIEAIATNAVMAGCRPAYMPVVVAAVEALLDERFDVQGLQATSDPAAPLVIVSGPVVQQVGINHGIGLFGHGNRILRECRAAYAAQVDVDGLVLDGAERPRHALRSFQLRSMALTVGDAQCVAREAPFARECERDGGVHASGNEDDGAARGGDGHD